MVRNPGRLHGGGDTYSRLWKSEGFPQADGKEKGLAEGRNDLGGGREEAGQDVARFGFC